MDKEDVVYIYIYIYNAIYSAIKRKKFELTVVRWMNLELVIQNGGSQKEKNKYCTLMYIDRI